MTVIMCPQINPVVQTIPVVDIPVVDTTPVVEIPVVEIPVAQTSAVVEIPVAQTSSVVDMSADTAPESAAFNFPLDFPAAAMGVVETHDAVLLDYYSQRMYDQLLFGQRDHLLFGLKERLDLDPLVQVCAGYHKNNGLGADATHSVSVLCRGLMIRYIYNLSYRKVEDQVRHNWLYRWFVGYPLFSDTFDHTTLANFEKWVREQHVDLFFVEVLRQIYEDFPEEMEQPQMGDTFAMQANAAKETLIRLIRHTSHLFLSVFADVDLSIYSEVMEQIDREALFGKEKERPEFYLTEKQRKERQLQVGQEALKLYELARPRLVELETGPEVVKMSSRLNQLNKILNDEFKILWDEKGKVTTFEKRKKPEKGSYRIGSATDPEATYRKHGDRSDLGFNIQIAGTTNFVTGIYAETGCVPDQVTIPNVLMFQYEQFGFWPEKFIYDQAAGTGKVVYAVNDVTDGNTQLVAKMVDHTKNSPRYGPADFTLSKDGLTMTCPNGQTTDRKYRHGGATGWTFRFIPPMCRGCDLLQECRGKKDEPITPRNVYYSDYRAPYLRAVNYNKTEEFKIDMKLRSQIERIIAGVVLHNGGRRARSRGIAKAGFQAKMNAMAYNIKRWMKLLAEKENPPKEKSKKGKYDLPAVTNS